VTQNVDLVILTRNAGPLHSEVENGVRSQQAVQLVVHRVTGAIYLEDRNRWGSIARARNEGKARGASRWLMFLDDDVVLGPQCIATLVDELARRPVYAALAADYLGEHRVGEIARHVSMGAALFRREALEQVRFRGDLARCECQSCCDELRQLHWGIDYCHTAKARHLPKPEFSEKSAIGKTPTVGENVSDKPMVTCMCVTRGRVQMLRRSIQCFLGQTYGDRELVVVYGADDGATRRYLAGVCDTSIYSVEVPAFPRTSLGSLRNVALQASKGKYVALWDDDDWYSPVRLAEQIRAIRETGKRGSLLARLTLYDGLTKRAYFSGIRPWEGSLVAERAIVPRYPDVAKREDTPVVAELFRQGQLTLLDRPELYIYTHHGTNTWDRRHWNQIVSCSQPLGDKTSRNLTALLEMAIQNPLSDVRA
jgi:glycosyltransferase involved in cell wall biosynthesis